MFEWIDGAVFRLKRMFPSKPQVRTYTPQEKRDIDSIKRALQLSDTLRESLSAIPGYWGIGVSNYEGQGLAMHVQISQEHLTPQIEARVRKIVSPHVPEGMKLVVDQPKTSVASSGKASVGGASIQQGLWASRTRVRVA